MKRFLKVSIILFSIVCLAVLGLGLYLGALAKDAQFDEERLVKVQQKILFFDADDEEINDSASLYTNDYISLNELPGYLPGAFISVEDKRFYSHNGIDYKRVIGATLQNLKSLKFKEGASTISQQLIKNTHLSSEKTIKRKAKEIKLTRKLEKKYSKEQILEMYLNTIYFGEQSYGINMAAKTYFDKQASELSPAESATLAAIIRSPAYYSPFTFPERCNLRKELILNKMRECGYLSEEGLREALSEQIVLSAPGDSLADSYLKQAMYEAKAKLIYPYNKESEIRIYTHLDSKKQRILEEAELDEIQETGRTFVLIDNKNGGVAAYYTTAGDLKRQPGSTIKPLLVYAPAIEENIIDLCTPILDEETDFSGYRPQNYNNAFHGYVSVKEALLESYNIPAVKVLNYTGIEKSKAYAGRMGLSFKDTDDSLALALGGMTEGVSLKNLTNAYSVFANGGNYKEAGFIRKITDGKGRTIFEEQKTEERIIGEDCAFLINDSLKACAKKGTARKLSHFNFDLAAKTGTVGTKDGNSDAYTISYSKDYSLGVWLGNPDGTLMPNSISGGSYPAVISSYLWDEFLKSGYIPSRFDEKPESIIEADIDGVGYRSEHIVRLADENAKLQDNINAYFKKDRIPKEKSKRYSNPVLGEYKISFENEAITIVLCLEEYYSYELFRSCGDEKKCITVFEGAQGETVYTDSEISSAKKYIYSVVPSFTNLKGEKISGKETIFPSILVPQKELPKEKEPEKKDYGKWWEDEFDTSMTS